MCGIAGIAGKSHVALDLYEALSILQHRGQDAAGMATCSEGKMFLQKANGLVRDVFQAADLGRIVGTMGIGHVRYPTAGCHTFHEAQPFYVNSPYGIALAHNGNLTNAAQLKKELFQVDRRHINTDSDSEILLNVFAHELHKNSRPQLTAEDVFKSVRGVHRRCRGGYAVVAMINGHGLVGFRDPHGVRPAVLGERRTPMGSEYMIASESCALDVLGFTLIGDIAAGEAVYIDTHSRLRRRRCSHRARLSPCIFEYVYLARPDSIMDGTSVYQARQRMGRKLAAKINRQWPRHDIDVVMPVPDTSLTAAFELANCLGVTYREGFIKNRYINRTFIMPNQRQRELSVRRKLNPIAGVQEFVGLGTPVQDIHHFSRRSPTPGVLPDTTNRATQKLVMPAYRATSAPDRPSSLTAIRQIEPRASTTARLRLPEPCYLTCDKTSTYLPYPSSI
jgi:amidophosphoribosyltransferase